MAQGGGKKLTEYLRWEFNHGRHAEWYTLMAAEGFTIPAVGSQPELTPDLLPIWDGYALLHASRPELSPIPFGEKIAALNFLDITDPHEANEIITLWSKMDREHLNLMHSRLKQVTTHGKRGK